MSKIEQNLIKKLIVFAKVENVQKIQKLVWNGSQSFGSAKLHLLNLNQIWRQNLFLRSKLEVSEPSATQKHTKSCCQQHGLDLMAST